VRIARLHHSVRFCLGLTIASTTSVVGQIGFRLASGEPAGMPMVISAAVTTASVFLLFRANDRAKRLYQAWQRNKNTIHHN
jgi:hypothetical protein